MTLHTCDETTYLELVVSPYFHKNIYLNGDSVLIKNLNFLKLENGVTIINKDLTDLESDIKKSIERQIGNIIIDTDYTQHNHVDNQLTSKLIKLGFRNKITIPLLTTLDTPNIFHWNIGGNIINKSIQPVFTLKISTKTENLTDSQLLI